MKIMRLIVILLTGMVGCGTCPDPVKVPQPSKPCPTGCYWASFTNYDKKGCGSIQWACKKNVGDPCNSTSSLSILSGTEIETNDINATLDN